MPKIALALMFALALPAAAKPAAAPKEPPPPVFAHVAEICKATGGFGRVFGRGYGHVDTTAGEEWAPFEKLAIESGWLTAEASFRGATDTVEGDVARAEKFLKALNKAVAAKGKFKRHDTRGDETVFESGREAGPVLELRQERDVIVAVCHGG